MAGVEITENGFGQTHDLRLGDGLVLRLHENPTTGFRWVKELSGDGALQPTDDRFEPGGVAPRPGAAGHRIFQFVASRAGTVHIALARKRAWESASAENAHLTVVVR
jgi:inhibitor of cysteine peptidase